MNLIQIHPGLTINEIPLSAAIVPEYANFTEYREYELLQDRKDAKGLVLALSPLILRINIDIVFVSMRSDATVRYCGLI